MQNRLIIMLSMFAIAAFAGVPVRWTAETSRVQPHVLEAWRGDTLDLECTLKSYGQPVDLGAATASFMWQTNGMGTAWWQTNATISADGVIAATWSPSMDPGGAEVAFFMPVVAGDGASYRAAGRIRFRPSPGAGAQLVPLPQPGGTIDFGNYQLVNAPWATLAAANAAIAAAVTSATGALVIPPAVDLGPYATTGYVAGAVTSATGALVIPPPADLTPYATTGEVASALQALGNGLAAEIQAVSNTAMPRAEMGGFATTQAVADAILNIQIPSLAGYATESYVADYFATNYTPPDLSSYASRAYADAVASNAQAAAVAAIPSLAGYATEAYVADYFATNYVPPDLSSYASRAYADAAASNAQATAIAAIPSLAGYATESYVAEYFQTNYTPPDLSSYASRSYADAVASNAQATAIAAIPSLAGYATESYVAEYFQTNYVPPDLSSYATTAYADAAASNAQATAIAAIPSLAGYATEDWVSAAIAAIQLPSLDGYATVAYADAVASNAQATAIAAIPSLAGYATESYVSDAIDAALADGVVISYQYETTRLATPDGLTFQDATGVLWRVAQTLGWIGTVWTNSQDYSASSTGFTFEVVFAPGGTNQIGEQLYTNAEWGVVKFDTSMELAWVWSPPWSGGNAYPNGAGTGDTNVYTLATTEADGHFFSASLAFATVGAETNAVDRVLYESSGGGGGDGASLAAVSNVVNAALGAFSATGTVLEATIAGSASDADYAYYLHLGSGAVSADDLIAESTNAAVAVADSKISTNNAAFVSAVLAAPLVGADPSDLSELAEYGSYGTVGAAILALIAGLAALKRRMTASETAIDGKQDKYPMVAVAPSSGTLTVAPYTVATYTAGSSAEAFTVAVGAGTTGKMRDCILVIDGTATGAVAPTVTWPSNFHPRTDAGTDFACEATRNVYYISEYATGQFAVGGWQETTGGNA